MRTDTRRNTRAGSNRRKLGTQAGEVEIGDLGFEIRKDLVVFVPDGALALVPFGAFTDALGRPLVERHTVATAPSVS